MNGRNPSHIWQATPEGLLVTSHNELQGPRHKSDFPNQAAITEFLRGLLRGGRTQVTWSRDSGVAYNTLTNYFSAKPPKMSAENLLRLIVAADAVRELGEWLAKYGGTWHAPVATGFLAISPEDQADLEAHEAAAPVPPDSSAVRSPSGRARDAASQSRPKPDDRAGKGKARQKRPGQ